jgi:4-hydroxybutyrate dehydrogenase
MKLFQFKPQIHRFKDIGEMDEFFHIGPKDLVFTNEFFYDSIFKPSELKAHFIFQEKYGLGEPSDVMVNQVIEDLKGVQYERVFAIGGGTVIDIAKLLVLQGSHKVLDLFDRKVPIIKDKQLIIVPTTCGTGSEVTNLSILEIKERHTKMGLAADELYADYAVLIPDLVKGLPYKFFVYSSVDALIHAIESFVSPKANPYTELYSIKAIEMIIKGYQEIVKKGQDHRMEIMEDFLIASNYAGVAFGNAGVGAVHALSYPLGGAYHVPHGEANYQFFAEVFKAYNRLNPDGKIKEANAVICGILGLKDQSRVYDELENLLKKLLPLKQLKEYGMKEEEVELFTDSVIEKQQRLLVNNYVPLSREEILAIYKKRY